MSEIERGKRNPSGKVLERIAQSLDVELEQFLALDSWSALKEFKEMLEGNRELSLALSRAIRAIKAGHLTEHALADRLLRLSRNSEH